MKRSTAFLIIAVGFTCLCSNDLAASGHKKMTKRDLPASVVSSFEKSYPTAVIKGIGKEKENGATYYEVESMDGKTRRDLLYSPDGTLVEIEETISIAKIPQPVTKTFSEKFVGYSVVKAEKVTKGGEVSYELTIKQGKGKKEVVFDSAGKVLKPK